MPDPYLSIYLFIATCQPPAGYTFEASVDKYYKVVHQSVNWQQAKDGCISDGTKLVELRTAAEHLAIRPIFGISLFNLG